MRFSSVFLLETLCFCSVFMIKLAPEKLCYYFFLLCFHYWGHCQGFLAFGLAEDVAKGSPLENPEGCLQYSSEGVH